MPVAKRYVCDETSAINAACTHVKIQCICTLLFCCARPFHDHVHAKTDSHLATAGMPSSLIAAHCTAIRCRLIALASETPLQLPISRGPKTHVAAGAGSGYCHLHSSTAASTYSDTTCMSSVRRTALSSTHAGQSSGRSSEPTAAVIVREEDGVRT